MASFNSRRLAISLASMCAYWAKRVLIGAACFVLSSCWVDSNESDPVPQPEAKVVALDISVSSGTASVTKPIAFKALSKAQNTSITSYVWHFSDGQSKTGQDVSVSFAAAGVIDVKVEVATAEGALFSATTSVSIFNGSDPTPDVYGLPNLFGDADGDQTLTVLDVLTIAQANSNVASIPRANYIAADIDLDRRLTATDLGLVMSAVLHNEALPAAILTKTVYPGSIVSIVAPELLDPDSKVELRVGGIASPPPARAILGYATALVSSELAVVGDSTADIYINGALVRSLPVSIIAAMPTPADSAADILSALAQARQTLIDQQSALADYLTASGVPTIQQSNILASGEAGIAMFDDATIKLQELFATEGGKPLADLFQKALYANGLREFRDAMSVAFSTKDSRQRVAALTPDQVCDTLIPVVCAVKITADRAGDISGFVSGSCSAVAIAAFGAGLLLPEPVIEAAVLAAFLEICVPLSVAANVGSVISSLFDPIDLALKLAATPTSLTAGQTSTLTSAVEFSNVQELCAIGADQMQGKIGEYLGGRIVGILMTRVGSLQLLAKIFREFGEDAYGALLMAIQDSVNSALDEAGLTEAFSEFLSTFCPNISLGVAVVPANRVFANLAPDEGTLQFNSDATATYSCPAPGGKPSATIRGELRLCESEPDRQDVTISCGSSEVTITMGDNGFALDDIFEVLIDGQTVLTSSSPTRSTSITIMRLPGQATVTMRGLAAPDGIGTYFISFSGATVISGDPLSGTDLTPGVTKTFVIEVP